MNTAWVGVVGVLAGVALTGGLSLIGGALSRRHDKRERRYEIRRDAYVEFNSTVERAISTIRSFVFEVGEHPADREVGGWREADLRQAFSLVRLVGPGEVVTAAQATLGAVFEYGYNGDSADAERVRADFLLVAQRALGLD